MVPVAGAKDALAEMEAMGHELFICSSPLSTHDNSVQEKYEWVERNLGAPWVKRIVLTKDKTIVMADLLIDDKPIITGVESAPVWEHILYDRPYNREIQKRRMTWDNWKEILLPTLNR